MLKLESSDVWHERLGHLSHGKIKRLMDQSLIQKSRVDLKRKCEVCVQAKQLKKPYKFVKKNANLLELIRSDVCDSNRPPTRAGNK